MGYTSLWVEGFEHYYTDQSGEVFPSHDHLSEGLWTEITGFPKVVSTLPRTGSYCLETSTSVTLRRTFGDDYTRVGLQFGMWVSNLPSVASPTGWVFGQLRDSDNRGLIGFQLSTTGRVQIMKGGLDANGHAVAATQIAESTLELAPGAWNHFEIKVFFDAAGYVKVRVNGRDFVSYSGDTTGGSGLAGGAAAQVAFGQFDGSASLPGITTIRYDDIAVGTWEAADDSTFLGQYGVYYLKPTVDTAVADWALTTGVNGYALIDEVEPDDNTNFIYSENVDDKSAFTVEPLPANIVSVAAVMPIARLRKTDAGTCSVQLGVISTGTEDLAASDHPLVTSYDYYYDIWMLDPHTGDVWNPLVMPQIQVKRTE
jgi:hypothetical protein